MYERCAADAKHISFCDAHRAAHMRAVGSPESSDVLRLGARCRFSTRAIRASSRPGRMSREDKSQVNCAEKVSEEASGRNGTPRTGRKVDFRCTVSSGMSRAARRDGVMAQGSLPVREQSIKKPGQFQERLFSSFACPQMVRKPFLSSPDCLHSRNNRLGPVALAEMWRLLLDVSTTDIVPGLDENQGSPSRSIPIRALFTSAIQILP